MILIFAETLIKALGGRHPIDCYKELPLYITVIHDMTRYKYDPERRWYYHVKTDCPLDMLELDDALYESDPNYPHVRFFDLSKEKVRPDGTPVLLQAA